MLNKHQIQVFADEGAQNEVFVEEKRRFMLKLESQYWIYNIGIKNVCTVALNIGLSKYFCTVWS